MAVNKKPNFLVIVADDLGFSDIQPYGSEIDTPFLDLLAADGLRMTNFHTAQACSPTRSMLLSGTDNHIAGLGQMAEVAALQKRSTGQDPDFASKPGYEGYLNWKVAALPEILSDAGYHTMMSGKWYEISKPTRYRSTVNQFFYAFRHLGMTKDVSPSARGFAESFAFLPGCGSHFNHEPQFGATDDPLLLTSDGFWLHNQTPVDRKADLPDDFYSTEFFTDKLIQSLEQRTDDERAKPFFSYLAYTAPHWPMQAPREIIDKYRGRYDQGPDNLTATRLEKLKALGLVPHDVESALPVGAEAGKQWAELTDEERAISARKMEVFAAMVDVMDQNIGRVVASLEASGELDNTFIVFMSDNGAEGASLEAAPLLGSFKTLGDLIEEYYDNSLDNIGNKDSYVWYGSRWACAATAPSRGFKVWSTEGGIRCPCLIRYPPATRGQPSISNAFTTVMDIVPTILELAQVQHPAPSFRGRTVVEPRGRSWVNHLLSQKDHPHVHDDENHVHGWELFGNRAVRQGAWKAVLLVRQGCEQWELYNLAEDPAEQHDLAETRQDILDKLLVHWATYVAETGLVEDVF